MSIATQDDAERLLELLGGFAISQIVCAAAQLGLAEHLAGGPRTLDELAARTATQIEPLRRLVQIWCHLGLLQRDDAACGYRGTPMLALFGTDSPRSLRGMARLYGVEYYAAWSELLHTVRTGGSAFERHHGASLWSYLAGHAPAAAAFAHAMSFNVSRDVPRILESFDFASARVIVDVGSANGELLAAILARHPALRGVAFDLPRVGGESGTVFAERGLAERCDVVTGDFFDTVPAGGDLYLLKAVLHNWDDERALRILRNCRAAMRPGDRLLVIERPGPGASEELGFVMKDLWMMVLFGGRDRTTGEYIALVERAGFAGVHLAPGPLHPALIAATHP